MTGPGDPRHQAVHITGRDLALLSALSEPIRRALEAGAAHGFYRVEVGTLGRHGDVLLRIDGVYGHVGVVLRHEDLAGDVCGTVRDALRRSRL